MKYYKPGENRIPCGNLFVVICAMLFSAIGVIHAADGVFVNPNFETGTVDGWFDVMGDDMYDLYATTPAAYSGTYGLLVDGVGSSGSYDGSFATIITNITPGHRYKLSFFLRTSLEGTGSQIRIRDTEWLDASDNPVGSSLFDNGIESGVSWYEVIRNADGLDDWWTAPDNAVKLRLVFGLYHEIGESYNLDDFQLVDLDPFMPTPTPQPIIDCWHVPDSLEVCNDTTSMREPEIPLSPSLPVWIHTGVHPTGGPANLATLYYRESTTATWSHVNTDFECNYNSYVYL